MRQLPFVAAAVLVMMSGAAFADDDLTARPVGPCPAERVGTKGADFTTCPTVKATGLGDTPPVYEPAPPGATAAVNPGAPSATTK